MRKLSYMYGSLCGIRREHLPVKKVGKASLPAATKNHASTFGRGQER